MSARPESIFVLDRELRNPPEALRFDAGYLARVVAALSPIEDWRSHLPVHLCHLHLDAIAALYRSDAERIQIIKRKHFIPSPGADGLLKELEWRLSFPRRTRCPCILIEAPSGTGKTTLIERFYASHPAVAIPNSAVLSTPILVCTLSGVNDRKEFARLMRRNAGLLESGCDPAESIDEVCQALNAALCRFLFLDEFGDVLGAPLKEQKRIMMLVKKLANGLLCPIGAACSDEGRALFTSNPHLKNRFRQARLETWKDDDIFYSFWFDLVSRYPLRLPSKLFDPETRKEIIARSEGNTESIVLAASYLAEEAVRTGSETIDRDALFARLYK